MCEQHLALLRLDQQVHFAAAFIGLGDCRKKQAKRLCHNMLRSHIDAK